LFKGDQGAEARQPLAKLSRFAFGLRTRASIRAYQKAENLPITGQVDAHTAAGFGVRPESTWGTSPSGGREVGHRNKPSAGIRLTKRRTSKGQSKQVAQERNAIDADGGNADNNIDAPNQSVPDEHYCSDFANSDLLTF
jgi:peptidoglycan hydrolase-like protein with peptidoglycan-binding domain